MVRKIAKKNEKKRKNESFIIVKNTNKQKHRKDATVRELIDLIRSAVPAAKQRDARISVGLVYVDSQGKPSIREISTAVSTRSGKDDAKTLDELRFEVGDCLSFAIHPA